jgi:hypothetical protein
VPDTALSLRAHPTARPKLDLVKFDGNGVARIHKIDTGRLREVPGGEPDRRDHREAVAVARDVVKELNGAISGGFTSAELEVVARWLGQITQRLS